MIQDLLPHFQSTSLSSQRKLGNSAITIGRRRFSILVPHKVALGYVCTPYLPTV